MPNISYFAIDQDPLWEIAVSYKKGSYLSSAARDLISIASEYWVKKMDFKLDASGLD